MFSILIIVVGKWGYTFMKQSVHLTWMRFIACKLNLNKVGF